MATIRRGALELDLPNNVSIAQDRPDTGPRRRGSDRGGQDPIPPALVVQALGDQLTVVDTVPLQVSAAAPSPRRSGGAATSAVMRVDVATDEHAVALVEQDGYYSWVMGTKEAQPPKTRRDPSAAVVTFELPLETDVV